MKFNITVGLTFDLPCVLFLTLFALEASEDLSSRTTSLNLCKLSFHSFVIYSIVKIVPIKPI